jgi:hypothetical protein
LAKLIKEKLNRIWHGSRSGLKAMESTNRAASIYQWQIIGWLSLSLRFVQGWIFWGGGSRRFIYDPQKLNPSAPEWMANKLQSAMPGALFDLTPVISFLLHHFVFLYIAIIAFSLLELLSGVGLIFDFLLVPVQYQLPQSALY